MGKKIKPPEANTATHALPPSQSIQSLLFYTLPEVPISFKSFFMTSSHPRRRRLAFRLALHGWPKRTIFGNLSSFIHTMCPNHLSLSFSIAPESGIKLHFLYSLLFEIRSVSRVPWKTSSKSSSAFRSARALCSHFFHILITIP